VNANISGNVLKTATFIANDATEDHINSSLGSSPRENELHLGFTFFSAYFRFNFSWVRFLNPFTLNITSFFSREFCLARKNIS
jgi:hypothetical protein